MNWPPQNAGTAPVASLLDRHDVTAERHPEQTDGQPASENHSSLAVVAAELAVTNDLLRGQNTSEPDADDPYHLSLTDREPAQIKQRNFPVPGVTRFLVRRAGDGGTFVLAAATPVLIAAAQEARFGITVVNMGVNPVTLFLAVDLISPTGVPLTQGAPQIGIPAGQSWNGQVGSLPWGGNVTALSAIGTTLTVAVI